MQTAKIGKSAVEVNKLGLGTNAVGGHNLFTNLNDETGIEIVKTALDAGINLIDTAFMYGLGTSEELIGKAIKAYDRSKIVIATKGAQRVEADGKIVIDNSPEFLIQQVENSLKRLCTDYLDIFYIHFPDVDTPKNEAVLALNELKEAGKIRAIGVSNFSLRQLREANINNLVDIDEEEYNLINREAEEERFSYLKNNHISFVPFFPLASGLLTGKFDSTTTFPKTDSRSENPNFQGRRFQLILEKIDQIRPIAQAHDAEIAQIVLAWYLQSPNITAVIPGAKQPAQVLSNVRASNITLTNTEYDQIDQVFARHSIQ